MMGRGAKALALAVFAALTFAAPSAAAQERNSAPYGAPIQLAPAQAIVAAAIAEAERNNTPVAVAVVDSGGNLVAFARMDSVGTAIVDVAIGKAYTAAAMREPSSNFEGWAANSSGPVAIPRIMPFGGGLPIEIDGRIVGGVGVSGAATEDDLRAAQAGLAALRR